MVKDIKKKGEKCKVCNSDIVYGLHTTNESFVGDWEKEFDKKFIPDKITWSLEEDKQIKSFIKSAIKEAEFNGYIRGREEGINLYNKIKGKRLKVL